MLNPFARGLHADVSLFCSAERVFTNPYTSTVHAVHKFIPLYNLGHNIFVERHVFYFQQNFIILCFRQSMEADSASLGKKQCDETQ